MASPVSFDVLVVGSGASGLAAAVSAERAGARVGLATKGTGDTVRYVIYQNLSSIMLQPKGRAGTTPVSLYQLLGSTSTITCQ